MMIADPTAALPVGDADFAGLLCARLCHDLISPAGAIGNGVELLRELGGTAGPELELIARSAGQVTAALQFLRLAFGPADGDGAVPLAGVQRVARLWFAHQRPALIWPDAQGDIPAREARLAANMLQIAVTLLPRGGEVEMAAEPGALRVCARGRAPQAPEAAEAWLAESPHAPAATSREVHWIAAARHARACGLTLGLRRCEGAMSLSAM